MVMVSLPVERAVTDYQVFTARTQAVQSVEIKARVTGYLAPGILFKDGGTRSRRGTFFSRSTTAPTRQRSTCPRAAVDGAKAALDQAKANLDLAKAALVKGVQADYDIGLDVQKQNMGPSASKK